jgi:hypothetical protein
VALEFTNKELGWPKIGLIRTAPRSRVHQGVLGEHEVRDGVATDAHWIPFEKGDPGEDGGGGARWRRENPIVIDWSTEAVALLRSRARQRESYRTPYFRNEHLWGKGGVTWNKIASYLRARVVPEGAIFGDAAATINPTVEWLTTPALLALLNTTVLDFTLRTFLSSRMNNQIGEIRRLPIPVLSPEETDRLTDLGSRALRAKTAIDQGEQPAEPLASIEAELESYTRGLYEIPRDAELWVVR